jgi:hypothetical protein
MTRWMHPPQLERQRERNRFDPVVEGARYALSREVSLAIWKRVSEDATDSAGRRDMEQAQQRFHKLAARIAARGGRPRPDVGKVTRVGVEIDGDSLDVWGADELRPRTPGRKTLVAVEAQRWARMSEPPASSDTSMSMSGVTSGVGPENNGVEPPRHELPGASEVAQAMAALQVSSVNQRITARNPPPGEIAGSRIWNGIHAPGRRRALAPTSNSIGSAGSKRCYSGSDRTNG